MQDQNFFRMMFQEKNHLFEILLQRFGEQPVFSIQGASVFCNV